MSCWVVPSIAAEMWGVPLNEITAQMSAGTIPTRSENGWTFVDIAPESPTMLTGPRIIPPTFAILTSEEKQALAEPLDAPPLATSVSTGEKIAEPDDSASVSQEDDAERPDLTWQNWHRVRTEVGRTRRRPPIAA